MIKKPLAAVTFALATLAAAGAADAGAVGGTAAAPVTSASVLDAMHRVADWQLANFPGARNASGARPRLPFIDWTVATYYAGHLALAGVSPRSAGYLDNFAILGRARHWQPAPRKETRHHADDHAIGQVYLEYAGRTHDLAAVAPMRELFDHIIAHPPENPDALAFDSTDKTRGHLEKWSWCDALFMAPPVLARLYEFTGDRRYLDFMNDRWWRTTDYLYDKTEHLFYRDSRYFNRREANGKKIFWGRGNGWVLGGIARVLQFLPAAYPDRPRYERLFRDMCARFLALQGADGLWRASLLDPAGYPAPETSSTGFAACAFAWGVNAGLLDRAVYWPAALKAWRGLLAHVDTNGRLGSCQPIGADPRMIKESDTGVYGPGAFLLAGAEIYKALILAENPHGTLAVANPANAHRRWASIEIPAAMIRELTGETDPAAVIVFDALAPLLRDTQARQTSAGPALLFQASIPPGDTRCFILVRKPAGFQGPEPLPFAAPEEKNAAVEPLRISVGK
jgi:rhamnogalacturonyl hydrolase YesR